MKRAALFLLTGVSALACCAQAFALSRDSANVKVSFVQPAGIAVVSPLVMPTVTATAISPTASFAGSVPSAGSTGALAGSAASIGNATLTIRGQAGDAVSMAVPESFQVVRSGGTETLTVNTNTNAAYGLSGDGVVLGGAGMGPSSMSVNVGGSIQLASAGATPGDYEGLLVVVVQYN
jgi:hypothetical protein